MNAIRAFPAVRNRADQWKEQDLEGSGIGIPPTEEMQKKCKNRGSESPPTEEPNDKINAYSDKESTYPLRMM